jgi:hypothetical protein
MKSIWNTWRCFRRAWCELSDGHRFSEALGLKTSDKWIACYIKCERCGRIVNIKQPNARANNEQIGG